MLGCMDNYVMFGEKLSQHKIRIIYHVKNTDLLYKILFHRITISFPE